MGRKLCIGANHSVVLDFMKAGKCVSVSKTFISMRFAYFPSAGLPLFMAAEMEAWGDRALCHSLLLSAAAFLVRVRRETFTLSLCPIKNLQMNVPQGENRCHR